MWDHEGEELRSWSGPAVKDPAVILGECDWLRSYGVVR
jgi:hypothetical protein